MHVQDYYNNITAKPRAVWLKTKKSKAAFTAGTPSQCQPVGTTPQQVTQPAPALAPAPSTQDTQSGGGNHQPHQVDHNKPKDREPYTCVNEHRCKEHWCSQCPKGGRWGNHLTEGHDQWLKLFLECKKKQKQKSTQNQQEQTQTTATNNNQGFAN